MRKYALTKPSLGLLVAVMILACGGTAYPSPPGDGPAGVVDSLGHDVSGARVLWLESIEPVSPKTPATAQQKPRVGLCSSSSAIQTSAKFQILILEYQETSNAVK